MSNGAACLAFNKHQLIVNHGHLQRSLPIEAKEKAAELLGRM